MKALHFFAGHAHDASGQAGKRLNACTAERLKKNVQQSMLNTQQRRHLKIEN
jgi:hypothetical protein